MWRTLAFLSRISLLKALLLSGFFFCLVTSVSAQPPVFRLQSYIETYSVEAVHQMVTYRIPASVTMAQAIFESQSGSSDLAKRSNNHFGIKCHTEWGGDTITKDDDTLNECFRKYSVVEDSWTDHSLFLNSRARYSQLFDLPIGDYKSWCLGLKASGYATYPAYADELIRLIEQAQLYKLDGYVVMDRLDYDSFQKQAVLKEPDLIAADLPLCDFNDAGILWEDENGILIQSLNFVVETAEDEDTDDYPPGLDMPVVEGPGDTECPSLLH